MPEVRSFNHAQIDEYFKGAGKVVHVDIKPAFGRKFKSKFLLYNGYIVVQDDKSLETITLRWFNLYPSQKKQLESLNHIKFLGVVSEFRAQKQIVNPQILSETHDSTDYIIEYPTVNKVSGVHLKKFVHAIPTYLWNEIPQKIEELGNNEELTLAQAFQTLHGKKPVSEFTAELKNKAIERLVYEEFLEDQLKILTRRKFLKQKEATKYPVSSKEILTLKQNLPFTLTSDQEKVLNEIIYDFSQGRPMMRMVQGDVGCGKTAVAFLASNIVINKGAQVALMCPTEALAGQHLQSFKELNPDLKIDLLLGSTKAKEKRELYARLKSGETQLVIGTHSLFQDSVEFNKLELAIIDEQHKFGVEQRLKLLAKGQSCHCLIMTATPIPRTLSLAQYGDLDISSIRTMPEGRIPIKTRITETENYLKYIDFVKKRLSMGEQAYFVFPAIEESEVMDIANVKESLKKYQEVFKGFQVRALHGQMKSDEKEAVLEEFKNLKAHILISTSVIEVGINIPNATIMSIYNPERFGLSSLHQLRGRVGRGSRPGFCFLVVDKETSPESRERLQVIEDNLDGFVIAEEDLKFRGEGDLFGVDQSGNTKVRRLASYVSHGKILDQVIKDLREIELSRPELLGPHFTRLAQDQKILDTI
ncbi:MAG TPA: ATP-dependent DNA helicase RecG [Bacteriovoracaceae bacterium]|nr:ATP-dependent DNA helicase RecG [Bacteriovoracaceae bacterium]